MSFPGVPQLDIRRPLMQITASRTLTNSSDNQKHIYNSGSTTLTLTIPKDTFSPGDEIEFAATGETITLSPGVGVNLNNSSATITIEKWQCLLLKFYSPNNCCLLNRGFTPSISSVSYFQVGTGSRLNIGNGNLLTTT
jgi:hypothetical protein